METIINIIQTIWIVLSYKLFTIDNIPIFGAYPIIGVIIVYRVRKYIYRTEQEPPEEFLRSNGSLDNAEYRTKRKIVDEYENSDFRTERWEDEHGKYWLIDVINMLFTDTFAPVKEDDESHLTDKQKKNSNNG